MLTELCAELRNYFEVPNGRYFGKFTISGGSIAPLDFLQEGQYFRIVGSVFNDGVYQYPAKFEKDEVFEGAVWAMALPPSIIALSAEIEAYNESDAGKPSPFTSESFGGYAYTKATDASGAPIGWQKAFASRLNKWRKL
jgi:hypothetical protein